MWGFLIHNHLLHVLTSGVENIKEEL